MEAEELGAAWVVELFEPVGQNQPPRSFQRVGNDRINAPGRLSKVDQLADGKTVSMAESVPA
jgi:hypothetical protein